jgi:hypothetical protein
VQEVVALRVLVGILVADFLQMDAFKRVVGGHAEVGDFFAGNAADRHLHVGSHPGRSLEFVLNDEADLVVVTDCMSLAEGDYVDAGHNCVRMG